MTTTAAVGPLITEGSPSHARRRGLFWGAAITVVGLVLAYLVPLAWRPALTDAANGVFLPDRITGWDTFNAKVEDDPAGTALLAQYTTGSTAFVQVDLMTGASRTIPLPAPRTVAVYAWSSDGRYVAYGETPLVRVPTNGADFDPIHRSGKRHSVVLAGYEFPALCDFIHEFCRPGRLSAATNLLGSLTVVPAASPQRGLAQRRLFLAVPVVCVALVSLAAYLVNASRSGS